MQFLLRVMSSKGQILEVIRMGHPTLKKLAESVSEDQIKSGEIAKLSQDMFATLTHVGSRFPSIQSSLIHQGG